MKQFFYLFIFLLLTYNLIPLKAQGVIEQEPFAIVTANEFSYTLQKYTGFNYLLDFLAEATIKVLLKVKTKTKEVQVDLKAYSGWDLVRKKAKSLNLKAQNLFVKNIPIEYIELITEGPIYFKKKFGRKNQVVIPLDIFTKVKIDLTNVTDVLNTLPRWKKVFQEIDLPIPPFGTTKISLHELKISIEKDGLVQANCIVRSLVNPESEPLKMLFYGYLTLKENKLIINNIQTEMEDIFTKDSDVAKSFSEMLEDLINPIFDFHKFERGGLRIVHVILSFEPDKLLLDLKVRLLPEEEKETGN